MTRAVDKEHLSLLKGMTARTGYSTSVPPCLTTIDLAPFLLTNSNPILAANSTSACTHSAQTHCRWGEWKAVLLPPRPLKKKNPPWEKAPGTPNTLPEGPREGVMPLWRSEKLGQKIQAHVQCPFQEIILTLANCVFYPGGLLGVKRGHI